MIANLNAHITDPLEELIEIYENVLGEDHGHRAKTHKQLVTKLKDRSDVVTDIRQLLYPPLLPCFKNEKSSSRQKVEEILAKGSMEKLDELKKDPRVVGLKDLTSVWGIGIETARSLYARGFHSVDEVRAKVDGDLRDAGSTSMLQPQQLIGLRHHAEFQQRMPRAEAEAIGGFVAAAAEAACPGCSVTLAGSFRRGKPTCGDVDVLIAPSDTFMRWSPSQRCRAGPAAVGSVDEILPAVLASLHADGVVTADLTKTKGFRPGERSYMGVARLPPVAPLPGAADDVAATEATPAVVTAALTGKRDARDGEGGECDGGDGGCDDSSRMALSPPLPERIHRRLDIKVYQPDELPFALLYFTGSDYFNRSMRWWAKKKNLSLNDKGFFRVQGNRATKVHGDFREEADVFKWLKLAYVAPADRSM